MPETLTVPHADMTVTVRAATVRQGMERTRLRLEGRKVEQPDMGLTILRLFTYPDLVSATVSAQGLPWPLTFEQFLDLPDALVGPWERAVYALNPHWLPESETTPDPKETATANSTGD